MSRKGIGWKLRKSLCKGKGCHNPRPPGKDLCRECWKGQRELDALAASLREMPSENAPYTAPDDDV